MRGVWRVSASVPKGLDRWKFAFKPRNRVRAPEAARENLNFGALSCLHCALAGSALCGGCAKQFGLFCAVSELTLLLLCAASWLVVVVALPQQACHVVLPVK